MADRIPSDLINEKPEAQHVPANEVQSASQSDKHDSSPGGNRHKFPVIGIGASAGGLDSLETLFAEIPKASHAAFVVVQHLSPDFKSMMEEILSRQTDLKIRRIEDGMQIDPETVYLIPPNFDLELDEDTLKLRERETSQGVSYPIDRFFRSLAISRGIACAAIICSGSGTDGSRGIRDICERGGMVLVEDPETANFRGMPEAAVESGVVDFVGPANQLAVWAGRFIESFNQSTDHPIKSELENSVEEVAGLKAVTELLRTEYGIDFLQYKPNMILRRIERRLHLMHFSSIDQYVQQLNDDPSELNQLYRDLLIGVTRFFRDIDAFDALSKDVIPDLVRQTRGRTLRVWTPGCATGEETYSLTIRICEAFEAAGREINVKIFATDAHRSSLDKAALGIYSSQQVECVPEPLRTKYFDESGKDYQVKQKLRKLIVFAPHNLLQDASFTKVDLVVCRNTLIYFKSDGQRRALALMHFGLRTGGYLFLGPSETPGQIEVDYETVNRRWRLYRKIAQTYGGLTDLRLPSRRERSEVPKSFRSDASVRTDNLIQTALERMASTYVPPSFVTDADFRLLYSTEGAADYIKRQQGKFDATLPDLLLPDLKTTVLIGLQRLARQELTEPVLVGTVCVSTPNKESTSADVEITGRSGDVSSDEDNASVNVAIIIRKLMLPDERNFGFLVTLERSDEPNTTVAPFITKIDTDVKDSLESELRRAKESLQASIEALETSNEELQATNEEMVASNEELQSTNEELHSVNEELYTVNSEHQNKIEELTELTEDMENLFRASDMATIFLDEEFRIRRLTPKAADIFNLTKSDVGRPLENFRNPLKHADLYQEIAATFKSDTVSEHEVLSQKGGRYLLRLLPYNSAHSSRGVVMTLIDLYRLEAARKKMEIREARFRGTFENAAVGIAHVEFDGTWLRVNERLCEILGYDHDELLSSTFQSITHPDDLERDLLQFEQLKTGRIESYSLRKRCIHKEGHEVPIDLTVSLQDEPYRTDAYCIAVVQDASEQVAIGRQMEEGLKHRDQFLAVLSHELRNPLASLRNGVQLLKRNPDSIEDVQRYVSVLDRQTDHMTRLVEDLLDTSRIAQNKIKLQREVLDLKPIVVEAVESMRSGFLMKEQTLELDVDGYNFTVVGDRTRLLQVIENLLSNARRYTQPGGVIKVRLFVVTGQVTIEVEDNGSGIAPAKLESIFSMFTRGHETRETQGGLGIGLALARMLMDQHGGAINAESDGEGEGAKFSISLPLVPLPGTGVEEVTCEQEVRPAKSYRIVLVDDDDDARITMEALLNIDGHSVVTASDGLGGLAAIADSDPDFALVDLSMPGLSGIELAKELAKQETRCTLIALTGHGQQHDRDRTAEAGFQGHLVKPIDMSSLYQLMHDLDPPSQKKTSP